MKIIKYLFVCSVITLLAVSCQKGIDDIKPVSPGPDVTNPTVVVNYPLEGKVIRSPEEPATVTFKIVATDDIELSSVSIQLDGTEIGLLTSFKDYRRAAIEYPYSLTAGDHEMTVFVIDMTGKSATTTVNFKKVTAEVYNPMDGEVMYLPFNDDFLDVISGNEATVTGSPGFAEGKVDVAYAGATNAYLSFPGTGILGDEFSLTFWYKINATPLRAGIMAISPEGDSRNSGFRFLRENNGSNQNMGINFGIGETEVWMNPFITVPPDQDWMHVAISISTTHATIYVNGAVALETDITAKIDWTGCNSITIASGEPNFVYWEHYSDLSLYDELHMFNRAITAAEVQTLFGGK